MRIRTVTFTGADDGVDPSDLRKRRLGPIDFEDFRRVMCLPHRLWTQMET
jgi:hypothetical protein